MIGIIGAMSIETDALIAKIHNKIERSVGAYTFVNGTIFNKEVVVCRCGVGKVASASATSLLIHLYNPVVLINIGVAGGIKPLRQGDIVVATNTVQHDYDGVSDGLILGQVHGFNTPYFNCDEKIVADIRKVLDDSGYSYKTGTIASGDCFVSSKEKSQNIAKTFNAIAFDMESSAINQVCQMHGVRFTAIRAISDNGDDDAVRSFYEFLTEACQKSVTVLTEYIAKFA